MSHFSTTRLKKNLALALAACGMAVAAPTSQATIVYTDSPALTVNTPNDAIYFNLTTGAAWTGTNSLNHGDTTGAEFSLSFNGGDFDAPFIIGHSDSGSVMANELGNPDGYGAVRFAEGDSISKSLIPPYLGGYYTAIGLSYSWTNTSWLPGDRGYLGFQFKPTGQDDMLYGWADVSYNADKSLTLYNFAYEDDGSAIKAGAIQSVPEPSSVALTLLAAGGLMAVGMRKKAKARALAPLV